MNSPVLSWLAPTPDTNPSSSNQMAPSSLDPNDTSSPRLSARERSNSLRRKASIDSKTGQPYHYDHRRHHHHDPTKGRSPSPPVFSAKNGPAKRTSWPSYLIEHQLILSLSVVFAILVVHVINILNEARFGGKVDWIANFTALIPPPIWKSLPLSWTRASVGGPTISDLTPKAGRYDLSESWSSMAMVLQYQVINVNETTGERQVLYGKGWNDVYMIFLWFMIWTAVREAAMSYVFIPLGRYFEVGGPISKTKLTSNSNVAQGEGSKAQAKLRSQEYVREGKLLRFAEQDTTFYWRDYPKIQLDATMKWYYLIQLAFWIQQLALAILGIEKRRKDFLEFMIHHIITCLLVGFSYGLNCTSVGHAIFCAMDFSDIVLAACKMLKYMRKDRLADVGFVFFVFTWILSRHYYYGIIVWSVFTEIRTYARVGWDPSQGMYLTENVVRGFEFLLLSLYILLLFWLFMIMRIVVKVLHGENSQDVRSDDEEEEAIVEENDEISTDTKSNSDMTLNSSKVLNVDKIGQQGQEDLSEGLRSRSTKTYAS
ncbi:sphingosine N-acyltransferase lag1 [Haplosporangium sp. Z 27]|nr:sphingosine N-acyltransferase lag1 [Haplosporangium sp. Z 27]